MPPSAPAPSAGSTTVCCCCRRCRRPRCPHLAAGGIAPPIQDVVVWKGRCWKEHIISPTLCMKVGVPVLGVVENMSGLRQPLSDLRFVKSDEAGETDVTEWALNYIKEKAPELLSVMACSEVFDSSKGGAEKMCHEMGVPFLGKVPMDPQLCKAAEEGRSCFADQKCSVSAPALQNIVKKLIKTK